MAKSLRCCVGGIHTAERTPRREIEGRTVAQLGAFAVIEADTPTAARFYLTRDGKRVSPATSWETALKMLADKHPQGHGNSMWSRWNAARLNEQREAELREVERIRAAKEAKLAAKVAGVKAAQRKFQASREVADGRQGDG